MGSKKLKAVVLNGSKAIKYKNEKDLRELTKAFAETSNNSNFPGFFGARIIRILAHMVVRHGEEVGPNDLVPIYPSLFKYGGTAAGNEVAMILGDAPTKNWSGGQADFSPKMRKKYGDPNKILKREYKKYHCYACPWGCGGLVSIRDIRNGEFSHTHRPEYETFNVFGPFLLNTDQNSILYINELLNRAGMDSISAGGTVGFAIECYENGLLTKADTDGLELTWGNTEAIVELVKKMIAREGIGDLLADGSKAASRKIGKGSEAYAITAGGQEPGMHEARYHPGYGTQYSADPTPGRHTGGGAHYQDMFLWEKVSFAPEQKQQKKWELAEPNEENGQKTMVSSAYKSVVDGAGVCLFAMEIGIINYQLIEMMNAATGWELSHDEYLKIGMRIHTLKQMFGVKQGVKPKDFIMHPRIAEPLDSGPTKGRTLDTAGLVRHFWKQFGWDDKTGVPTPETLKMHGLDQLDVEASSKTDSVAN